ncbi:hypothetical protein ACQJBY_005843 [Aegilops geniculata]
MDEQCVMYESMRIAPAPSAVSGGGCTSWRQSVTPCSRSLQRRRRRRLQTGTLLMSTTLHRSARPQLPLSRPVMSTVNLTSMGDVHDHNTDEK